MPRKKQTTTSKNCRKTKKRTSANPLPEFSFNKNDVYASKYMMNSVTNFLVSVLDFWMKNKDKIAKAAIKSVGK